MTDDAMYRAAVQDCVDGPWKQMDPLILGSLPDGRGTPDAFVIVEANDKPLLRVDLYAGPSCFAFVDAIVWSGLLVIGWGEHLYLAELGTRANTLIELGSYFGHLYPALDHLLVASSERLFRIAPDRSVLWRSQPLGSDGVLVDHVVEGVVSGTGEWDPPGGWIPFTIDLATGE